MQIMRLSLFSARGGGGGDSGGIRQQKNQLDRDPRYRTILYYITNSRDFGHQLFTHGLELDSSFFKIV